MDALKGFFDQIMKLYDSIVDLIMKILSFSGNIKDGNIEEL